MCSFSNKKYKMCECWKVTHVEDTTPTPLPFPSPPDRGYKNSFPWGHANVFPSSPSTHDLPSSPSTPTTHMKKTSLLSHIKTTSFHHSCNILPTLLPTSPAVSLYPLCPQTLTSPPPHQPSPAAASPCVLLRGVL